MSEPTASTRTVAAEPPREFQAACRAFENWLGQLERREIAEPDVVALERGPVGAPGLRRSSDNVIGWGLGEKRVGEELTREKCLTVFVQQKLSERHLEPQGVTIPAEFESIPTDVVSIGTVFALNNARQSRPVMGGAACGHFRIPSWGTLGCMVVMQDNNVGILSNNHVLANENQSADEDPIVQPGPDGKPLVPGDVVAKLTSPRVDIDFRPGSFNEIDAAIAWTKMDRCSPDILGIGRIDPTPLVFARDDIGTRSVLKVGAKTGMRRGYLSNLYFTVKGVRYRNGQANFVDSLVFRGDSVSPFSLGGDSGSLILDEQTKRPVALLYAGDDRNGVTFACPIQRVLNRLNCRIWGG